MLSDKIRENLYLLGVLLSVIVFGLFLAEKVTMPQVNGAIVALVAVFYGFNNALAYLNVPKAPKRKVE